MSSPYFDLFQIEPTYDIDHSYIEKQYRLLAARFHPDKFASASSFEQRQAMMTASTLNEAYRTLIEPADRAAHLLSLYNIDADNPKHTHFATEFLMQQMEWREASENARHAQDIEALIALDKTIAAEQNTLDQNLSADFNNHELENAAEHVRQYRFLNKLRQEIQPYLP